MVGDLVSYVSNISDIFLPGPDIRGLFDRGYSGIRNQIFPFPRFMSKVQFII